MPRTLRQRVGDRVRSAAPQHVGSWPRVSVWHGNADTTVVPLNAQEIVKQWIDVHELSDKLATDTTAEGFPRQVWSNASREHVVEYYSITDMAHGTPLATGTADVECGTAGPYLLEVGISSSFRIAEFFHLTTADTAHAKSESRRASRLIARQRRADSATPDRQKSHAFEPSHILPRWPIDIGVVITAALKSAGLLGLG